MCVRLSTCTIAAATSRIYVKIDIEDFYEMCQGIPGLVKRNLLLHGAESLRSQPVLS
jgi:hypothetical protein